MTQFMPLPIAYTKDSFHYALNYSVSPETHAAYRKASQSEPNPFFVYGEQALPIIKAEGGILNGVNAYKKTRMAYSSNDNKPYFIPVFEADYNDRGTQIRYRSYDSKGVLSRQALINPDTLSEEVSFEIDSPYSLRVGFPNRKPPVPEFKEMFFTQNRGQVTLLHVKDASGKLIPEETLTNFKNNTVLANKNQNDNKLFINLLSEVSNVFKKYDASLKVHNNLKQ